MLAPVLLGAAYLLSEAERDWPRVASVNGVALDRAHLRAEVAFKQFLVDQQAQVIEAARVTGGLDAAQSAAELATLRLSLGDPVQTARNDLIDDELVRQLARREGVSARSVDPWQELATFLESGYGRHLRYISIAAPSGPSLATDVAAAATRAAGEIAHGAGLDAVLAELSSAGFSATGTDHSIGSRGPFPGIDPSILVGARAASADEILGPFTDRRGASIAGALISVTKLDPNIPDRPRSVPPDVEAG